MTVKLIEYAEASSEVRAVYDDICIASHGAAARKKGMTEEMFGELMAVVGMASETNRLVTGWRVPLDESLR